MAVDVLDDEDGKGQYRRETGYGELRECKATNGQRNAHVVINAEHLTDPIQGWVDTEGDRAVYVAGVAAFSQGQRIYYRIETRRKEGVDPTIPFDKLTGRQKVRDVRELTAVDGDGVPLAEPLRVQAPDPGTPDPGSRAPGTGDAPARRGPRIQEARPWEPYNSDQSLNLGSYAVQACEAMVLMAHDIYLNEAPEDIGGPTPGKLYKLAGMLLTAADRAQASTRADGHADRMDNSHTRARSAVRAALSVHPVPWGAEPEARDQWVDDLATYAAALLDVVVHLAIREDS